MELEFKRLIPKLKSINEEKALIAKKVFNKLPEKSENRVWWLLEEIRALKEAIKFFSAFPDGHI